MPAGDCGILIGAGPGEVQAYAEAINSLLNDPPLRRRMGAAARRKAEAEYDLRRANQAYRGLFE